MRAVDGCDASMFRLAKLRHDPSAVGDCFGYDFANGPLAFSDGIDTVLDKAISFEHGFVLLRPHYRRCRPGRVIIVCGRSASRFSAFMLVSEDEFGAALGRQFPSHVGKVPA